MLPTKSQYHLENLINCRYTCNQQDPLSNYKFNRICIIIQARRYIESIAPQKKRDFKDVFRGANPLAIDLLERMLELDADKRITAEQALAHSYLEKYADPNDEPVSALYDQSFETNDFPLEVWKGKKRIY